MKSVAYPALRFRYDLYKGISTQLAHARNIPNLRVCPQKGIRLLYPACPLRTFICFIGGLNLPDSSSQDNVEYVFSVGRGLRETLRRIVHYVVDPMPTWASVGAKKRRKNGKSKKMGKNLIDV